MWWQILDKPTGPKNYWLERTRSLMFSYALARGAERGWLPAEFLEHARRATRGVLNREVDLRARQPHGHPRHGAGWQSRAVSGGFYDYYVGVPVVTNDQKSIGAFMFLSLALSEIANPATPRGREGVPVKRE